MNYAFRTLMIGAALALSACGSDDQSTSPDPDKPPYVTLDAELTQLKADFNAMSDKVRLVFISGPSCGICLRGMDDLNRSIVASIQNDARIHTLVIQVPALNAEEKHVGPAVQLMPGPRVSHYWDPQGDTGIVFMDALNIEMYAWDVWMIYEPGDRWEVNASPPPPAFWQHQLGPLPKEKKLDADQFAAEVRARLAELPAAGEAVRVAEVQRTDPGIISVAQPRGVMIMSNHHSRGGYQELKSIQAIRYEGETVIDGQSYPLTVITQRPYDYERAVTHDTGISTIRFDGANIVAHNEDGPAALPLSIRDDLLASYEFDGWMTDWKAKGHDVYRLGMKKYDDRLPWLMEAKLTNGRTWQIYVDSHSGDAFRHVLIGPDGEETLAVEYDDYRDADGFRLPHEIRYYDSGTLLATDRFQQINVTREALAPES
jgi:hypothetical protein